MTADAMETKAEAIETAEPVKKEVDLNGLSPEEAARRLEEFGRNEIPEVVTPSWKIFLNQFLGLMPFMIEVAAVLALIGQDWIDFAIIAVMLALNAVIGFHEEMKAQASIGALKDGMISKVAVRRGGEIMQVDTAEIVPGDILFLRGGQVLPADGQWIEGDTLQVDTAALTGEPFPRKIPSDKNDREMLSGMIIKQGECYFEVEKTGYNTEIGNAAAMIQAASGPQMGYFEKKIMNFVKLVILFTLLLIAVVIVVQLVVYNSDGQEVLLSALTIIIAAVPIALPIVMKITQALGAVTMAKEHAIVTSLPALQEIASMSCLCSDKTGTLTTAQITIFHDLIHTRPGYTQDDVLIFAAMASNPDNVEDPIDAAVLKSFNAAYGEKEVERIRTQWVSERIIGFNATTKRSVGIARHEGKTYYISKGLLNKVLITGDDGGEMMWKCENADELLPELQAIDVDFSLKGYKTIACSCRIEDGPWKFCGIIPMLDPPRHDTKDTIAAIRDAGIRVKMITGDHTNIAKETAGLIGLGKAIYPCTEIAVMNHATEDLIEAADGFAQALPKDKLEIVASLQDKGYVIGMTGDGVNDAPALAKAQIGIAVQGATDAAQAAADIVLTAPGLSAIYTAVVESRKIFRRIKTYIIYRMASTVQLVIFLVFLIFAYNEPLDPIYVILLAVLNDVATLTLAYDRANPSKDPEIPTLIGLVVEAGVYGAILLAEAIIFYTQMPTILGRSEYEVGEKGPGQGAAYLQLALSMLLLIMSTRTNGLFFVDYPSLGLVASCGSGLVFSTLFAGLGAIDKVGWREVGIIWGYVGAWFVGMDLFKIFLHSFMESEQVLQVRNNIGSLGSVRSSVIGGSSRASTQQTLERLSQRASTRGLAESTAVQQQLKVGAAMRFSNRTPGGMAAAVHQFAEGGQKGTARRGSMK